MRDIAMWIVVAAGAMVLGSCGKNTSGALKTYTSPTAYMKATIGDSSFSVTGTNMAWSSSQTTGGITIWSINGATTYGKTLQINFMNLVAIGTFTLPTVSSYAYYFPYGTSGSSVYAQSGGVTLTQMSPNLVGTFYFTCSDNTRVGNGVFSVPAP